MANLGLMMEAEERSNETRAGTNLKLVEELTMLTPLDRFVYSIPGNAIDRDAFREEEMADEFRKENSSVIIPNVDRVGLLLIMGYYKGMLDLEEWHDSVYGHSTASQQAIYLPSFEQEENRNKAEEAEANEAGDKHISKEIAGEPEEIADVLGERKEELKKADAQIAKETQKKSRALGGKARQLQENAKAEDEIISIHKQIIAHAIEAMKEYPLSL